MLNTSLPQSGEHRYRKLKFSFALATVAATVVLLAWGAFVTSIDAGLAVPDWPTTMDSLNPLNPWPEWWTATPMLAEHGHRLLAMVVGLMTVSLCAVILLFDKRRFVRVAAVGAVILVILQGVLGGLRVVLISLNLAVVHACVAQLFFVLVAAIALFNSRTWIERPKHLSAAFDDKVRGYSLFVFGAILIQIIFGALLRHPGSGLDTVLAITHVTWAFVVSILVIIAAVKTIYATGDDGVMRRWALVPLVLLGFQVLLGITAYFVILDEQGMTLPSNFQVITNSLHLVVGAFLLASTGMVALLLRHSSIAPAMANVATIESDSLQSAHGGILG